MSPTLRAAGVFATAVLFVGLSGCSTPETRREEMRAKVGPPQPPLEGTSAFFDGKIVVTANLNPAFRPQAARGEDGEDSGRPRGRPPGGGFGGGGEGMHEGRRRGGEMGEGPGGPRPGGGGGAAMNPPRQALTVALVNTSASTVNVQVTDVVSALGNFVPVPEKATLAPGETMTLEPMRGALANLDEFPLNLGLRADGKSEKQTLTLKRTTPP